MTIVNWIFIALGLGAMASGYFLITHEKYRTWSLNNGRARIWIRILGEERAHSLARYFFAPLSICFGIALILLGVLSGPIQS